MKGVSLKDGWELATKEGSTVAVATYLKGLTFIRLERALRPRMLKDGKLRQLYGVKQTRKGRTLVTNLTISAESEEALRVLLNKRKHIADERVREHTVVDHLVFKVYERMEKQQRRKGFFGLFKGRTPAEV